MVSVLHASSWGCRRVFPWWNSSRELSAMSLPQIKLLIPLLAAAMLSGCLGPYNLRLSMSAAEPDTGDVQDVNIAIIVPAATRDKGSVTLLPSGCIDIPLAPVPYGAIFRQTLQDRFTRAYTRVRVVSSPAEVRDAEAIFEARLSDAGVKHVCLVDPGSFARISGSLRALDRDGNPVWQSRATSAQTDKTSFGPISTSQTDYENFLGAHVSNGIAKLVEQWVHELRQANPAKYAQNTQPAKPSRQTDVFGKSLETGATGLYRLEEDITFNVLDRAEFDPESGLLTLAGHLDSRYATGRIPYLQHLAELIDHPRPEFSLNWTPRSEREVDAFLARLDDPDYQDKMLGDWTAWIGDGGKPTAVGKALFPVLGIQPTKSGGPGGVLGIQIRYGDYSVVVTNLAPGGAADRAGVRVGDEIRLVNNNQFGHAYTFARFIDGLGAGSKALLDVLRNGELLDIAVTLDPAPGDPWDRMTRYELIGAIFHAAGNHPAGQMVEALGVMDALQKGGWGQEEYMRVLEEIFHIGKSYNQYADLSSRGRNKTISLATYRQGLRRLLAESFDNIFDPYGRMMTKRFDARMQSGMNPSDAVVKTHADVDEILPAQFAEALRSLYRSRPEIRIPPEIIMQTVGIAPTVVPEYIGFDGSSQLARVLYHADYLGKSLVNKPELADRISGYQTEFSYYRTNPRRNGIAIDNTTERLWISVENFDLAQSENGQVLETRNAKLRFNIRDLGAGLDREVRPGDYEALLTSLYEDFALEYPVLHELREAAKLMAVANWIKVRDPAFELPREGRMRWTGPAELPGRIYFTWATERRPGAANFQIMATGGIALVPPVGPSGPVFPEQFVQGIPNDPNVVDLRGLDGKRVTLQQPGYRNDTLRRVLRRGRKGDLPVPRPRGWVTRATLGTRTLQSLSLAGRRANGFSDQDMALRRCLDAAQDAASHLAQTERLINNITQMNPQRQAELKDMESKLVGARRQFIEGSVDILLSGVIDASGLLDTEEYRALAAAKSELEGYRTTLERIKLAADTVTANDPARYDELISKLTDVARDLTEELAKTATGPTARLLKPLVKSVNFLEKAKNIFETGSSLYSLARSMDRLTGLGDQIDKENALLRDKLLPLQRRQSDLLNKRLKCPALAKAYL